MTSPSSFHKLRRHSNSIQTRSRYSTLDPDRFSQAVKLPTLNSINKSVKYNDISFSFTKDLSKLRKEPQNDSYLNESMAHSSLLTVRKRYDNLNKERENQEQRIKLMEVQKEKTQAQKDRLQEEKLKSSSKVSQMQEQIKRLKVLIEWVEMQKKIMNNMTTRLKHDKIIYDQQKYNKEKQLSTIDHQKRAILKQSASRKEEEDKTRKVCSKMMEHVEEEYHERESHINSMQYMIESKVQAYEGAIAKKAQTKEVAQIALSEKDNKEKNWYKVYLCQRFVQRMLKDKMDRQMNKFRQVEQAFKNIKTSTGVSTGQTLISKFLTKEQAYGHLLGKITLLESELVQLKEEQKSLNSQKGQLYAQKDALNVNTRDQKDLSKEEKEFHYYSGKAASSHLFEEIMKTWLDRNHKKFKKLDTKVQEEAAQNSNKMYSQFKRYLQVLSQSIQESETSNEIDQKQGINDIVVNDKNVRIKVNSSEKDLRLTDKQMKDSLASQAKEEAQNSYEEDYLQELRNDTIKNNEKFMKEIKKKYEEMKKQKIEAQPKRKDPIIEKPKAPPADQQK